MPVTPPIAKLKADVFKKFPQAWSGGDYVVRKIKDSSTWSQHSWGNALDVMVPSLEYGDKILAWITVNRAVYGTGTVLWRQKDHFDHLHIEGLPKQTGTPPGAGGTTDTRQPDVGTWSPWNPGGEIPGFPGETGSGSIIPGVGEIKSVADAVGTVFKAETWIRVGLFVGGAVAIAGGLSIFGSELGMKVIPMGKVAGKLASVVK
jgi:hypothetical protein